MINNTCIRSHCFQVAGRRKCATTDREPVELERLTAACC